MDGKKETEEIRREIEEIIRKADREQLILIRLVLRGMTAT